MRILNDFVVNNSWSKTQTARNQFIQEYNVFSPVNGVPRFVTRLKSERAFLLPFALSRRKCPKEEQSHCTALVLLLVLMLLLLSLLFWANFVNNCFKVAWPFHLVPWIELEKWPQQKILIQWTAHPKSSSSSKLSSSKTTSVFKQKSVSFVE